jgi:hypothetical protein
MVRFYFCLNERKNHNYLNVLFIFIFEIFFLFPNLLDTNVFKNRSLSHKNNNNNNK